jgi:hypothetical protein
MRFIGHTLTRTGLARRAGVSQREVRRPTLCPALP